MATFTLRREDVFPNGTTVSIYKASFAAFSGQPPGSPVESQTVAGGAATFTTLADNTGYIAYARVSGDDRAVRFRTPEAADAGSDFTFGSGFSVVDSGAGVKQVSLVPTTPTASIAPIRLSMPGELGVLVGTLEIEFPNGGILHSIHARVGTPPVTQSVILDINRNGTSLFADQARRPQILRGQKSSGLIVPDLTALAPGDVLTVDVDQVGLPAAPQVLFAGAQQDTVASAVNSYAFNRPASLEPGDVVIAGIRTNAGSSPWSPPTGRGWQVLRAPVGFTDGLYQSQKWWRIDDGDPAPHVFTSNAAVNSPVVHPARIWLRNVDPTAPINAVATPVAVNAATAPTVPALSPTVPGTTLVAWLETTTVQLPTPPTDYRARIGFGGGSTTRHIATLDKPDTGSVAAQTLAAGAVSVVDHIAVAPAQVPDVWSAGGDLVVLLYVEESAT